MKAVFQVALISLTCIVAFGDTLKLRDGRSIPGQFLGATRTEIWFQRDLPGEVMGTMAYPIASVESLTFGSDTRGSAKSETSCSVTAGLFRQAAWKTECVGSRAARKAATRNELP